MHANEVAKRIYANLEDPYIILRNNGRLDNCYAAEEEEVIKVIEDTLKVLLGTDIN